ncbi:MAG: hypothetical protein EBR82_12930 [Caulobacteraceae bacterium]|nr:hypothetical protein [Caulobacteraceae bacterium]
MARKGRFGRSASGSQNLSSLVYSLLKEERNNQEDTMLTAYGNNMRSGSAAGLFTSNGNTLPATASNLVAWYKAQADAADAVGDSAGAERFRTKAEEFRIQSLRDIETVLDNAYKTGNSVDLALIGGSGSAKIDGAEYEKWMNTIINDSSMTASDKERLKSKLFTVSYTYAAENMVNGFNEKKYTANNLISFYDKELERAKQNGLTETSQTYRDIVAARAAAVTRASNDAQAARADKVNSGIADETDAMAGAIQRLISPILKDYFSSPDVVDALTKSIGKGNGDEWLTRFSKAVQAGQIDYTQLFDAGATANGLTPEDMRSIAVIFGDLSREVAGLQAQGYGPELSGWTSFADQMSTTYTDGAYAASTRPYVVGFNGAYAGVGGNSAVPFSGEPSASYNALQDLVGNIAGAGSEKNVTDSGTTAIVSSFGSGYIDGLIPSQPNIKTVDDLVDYLSNNGTTKGMDKADIANSLAEWLFVTKTQPTAAVSGNVAQELYNLNIQRSMLDNAIGGVGGLTTADILRINIESSYIPKAITASVDASGNQTRAYVYRFNPKYNEFTFSVTPTASMSGTDYVSTMDKNGNVYYTQAISYTAKEGQNVVPIKFVPVPGGGNYSGGNDANDLILISYGSNTYGMTASQIENFASWYAQTKRAGVQGDYSGFSLVPDPQNAGKMILTAGADILNALSSDNGTNLATWMNVAGIKATDLRVHTYNGQILLGDDFIAKYSREIFNSGVNGTDALSAVKDWLKNVKGISDPGGKIANMIINGGIINGYTTDGGVGWQIKIDNEWFTNDPNDQRDYLPPEPAGSKPDPNAVASTDASFGWGGNPQPQGPTMDGTGMGGTAGVRGAGSKNIIPPADLMEHTFRNLAPMSALVSPTAAPPGGTAPIIPPGLNPDGPRVTAPMVSPGTPGVPTPPPSMRPSGRTPVVPRSGVRSL